MFRLFTIVMAFSALTALTACEGWQNVSGMGNMVCNKDGEGVVWAKPNSQGKLDTLKLSKENCYN